MFTNTPAGGRPGRETLCPVNDTSVGEVGRFGREHRPPEVAPAVGGGLAMVEGAKVRRFGLVVAGKGEGFEGGGLDGIEVGDLEPGVAPALRVAATGKDVPASTGADGTAPEAVVAAFAGAGLTLVEDPMLDLRAGNVLGELEEFKVPVAAERLRLGRVQDLDAADDVLAVAFEHPAVPTEVAVDLDVANAEVLVHPGAAGREPLLRRGMGSKGGASVPAVEGGDSGNVAKGGGGGGRGGLRSGGARAWLSRRCRDSSDEPRFAPWGRLRRWWISLFTHQDAHQFQRRLLTGGGPVRGDASPLEVFLSRVKVGFERFSGDAAEKGRPADPQWRVERCTWVCLRAQR